MLFRKIGKFLRGKASPFQIISATVLGGLLGSLPGLTQGPLLLAVLLFLVIVLNANLFLAGLTLLLVKLLYLVLLPVYFNIGVNLLEGGLGGLVAVPVNAPVTAWFGLDYYVMLPSLAVGGVFGLFLGILISRSLMGFRSKMANLESGSDSYQAYTSKMWIRLIAWLLLGGIKGKKSWSDLSAQKSGLPIRPLGVVFVVSVLILGYIGLKFLDQTIVTSTVRDALEQANGATVDIDGIEIIPEENRVVISGLALANPDALETNRFASTQIIADISGMNLLAKKVVIDSLQILEPSSGGERRLIGRRTTEAPEVEAPPPDGDVVSIDDYLGQASIWRERLSMVKRIYDRIAPHVGKDDTTAEEGEPTLTWRDQLALRAKEEGYANVQSDSLVRNSPRLWIKELKADNLKVGGSSDSYAISGSNLATQPALLEVSGHLEVSRMDGNFDVAIDLPHLAAPNQSGLKLSYRNLSVDDLEKQIGKDLPMQGGTMDLDGSGVIDGGLINLPVKVTLRNTTLNAFGTSVPLDEFPVEIGVAGPLDHPTLNIPKDAIESAIKKGGQQQIENLIKDEAGDKLKGLFKLGG